MREDNLERVQGRMECGAEGPKFVPGKIMVINGCKTFIPGKTFPDGEGGEVFVPGKVINGKSGPRFVPGENNWNTYSHFKTSSSSFEILSELLLRLN